MGLNSVKSTKLFTFKRQFQFVIIPERVFHACHAFPLAEKPSFGESSGSNGTEKLSITITTTITMFSKL